MTIRLDYSNMMAEAVGAEHGITDQDLDSLAAPARKIHRYLMTRREQGFLPVYDLPFGRDQLDAVQPLADELAGRFDAVVVLGIGGSALGTSAVARALGPLHYNLLDAGARQHRPRLFVLDNVDPVGVGELLDHLDPGGTVFLVISKSGSTVETMGQFMIAQDWVRRNVGDGWKDHFVLITDPVSGGLRRLVQEQGFRSCPIPERVGGRFTVLTPVSLLPLAMAGIDVGGLLEGAAAMSEQATRPELMENPAYLNAALQYLAYQKGLRTTVMMPYSDRLRDVADWFRQLWAESLGKQHSRSGQTVHVGPTPVRALGTTDQHSQVQLYMEGPLDKVVTFIVPDDYGRSLPIPGFPEAPALAYLQGRGLDELIRSEQQATAMALTGNGRPNCTLHLSAVTPETVGGLLYLFEVQTLFAGGLFDVNPLDQPGVEAGKEYTYALMGRSGFEEKKTEFDAAMRDRKRRIL